ncbi:MAG: tRNA (adenosine(37)-N6)-threonylcarbamoyltransferase complex dimerization subunit type 1 TsaB [Planctomycetes bacterium]|nr:tRNA (adenosine(37)-N6)-threonylcarbamoyltransferase complex dimerization subunit type 1 TsaB [Planctomycetota bacterium]
MDKIQEKSLVLTLETSGRAGSVALGDKKKIFIEKIFSAPIRHSAELFERILAALEESGHHRNQISDIYINNGPGSFTGIRIAVTAAKMMAVANPQIRVLGVKSSDVGLQNAISFAKYTNTQITRTATIIDAKRSHFFIALFEKQQNEWVKTLEDCLMKASDFVKRFADTDKPVWLLGEGLVYYKDDFNAKGIEFIGPEFWPANASGVFNAGRRVLASSGYQNPQNLTPFYLRRPEAMERLDRMPE